MNLLKEREMCLYKNENINSILKSKNFKDQKIKSGELVDCNTH